MGNDDNNNIKFHMCLKFSQTDPYIVGLASLTDLYLFEFRHDQSIFS